MSRTGTTTRDRAATRRAPEPPRRGTVTRLQLRRRDRMGPRRRRAMHVAVTVLLLLTAAWVLWASPLLAVRSVAVDGAGARLAGQIRQMADVVPGTPLLRVDVDAVRGRVAQLPQVSSVEVARGWPDEVVITVVERVPVAVVEHDGRRILVDAEGVLVDTISADPPEGVVPVEVAQPGPDDPATAAALSAVTALSRELRAQTVVVAAPTPETVTLVLTDGTTVVWGSGEESTRKTEVLTALLGQLAAGTLEPATTIDVSTPDAVVLR